MWSNPAGDRATVTFTLAAPSDVRLALYDVLGREVALLLDGPIGAGSREVAFDASALSVGVYVWRLAADERAETGQFTVAR